MCAIYKNIYTATKGLNNHEQYNTTNDVCKMLYNSITYFIACVIHTE